MIINTYLQKPGGMGLGDFLRGSLALYQMSHRYSVRAEIDFSHHPIGKYLVPSHNVDMSKFEIIEACNIGNYTIADLRDLIARRYRFSYLARNANNICVYTNVFPKFPITEEIKQSMQRALIPTPELQDLIPQYEQAYEVIHIRSGDLIAFGTCYDYTVNLDKDYLVASIIGSIKQIVANSSCPVLIMSDSLELKTTLTELCGTVKTETTPAHVGNDFNGVVDTLIDYFTLTKARKIHQFTTHFWGSGFSDSVSWIFDIPIQKYPLIENRL